ncbi:meiosis-specific protein ASY1-like [Nicotiana tabacum]|uniref:Meiosis-specific protein ASY1-like n=1 Tax=Nicotiana tabacum TaxID=4097 RepID=A0AC58USF0_TOBAC
MVVAQKVKESEITEQDSLLLTRNLLRIALFNITYVRGLFPENYFSDKSVPALEMKIKKLMPMDAESRRLIDWMEKGVYDALQKKYLKTLLFCVCETIDGPMIEEYAFSFCYSNSDSQEVSMNINRIGTKKGGTFKCNSTTEITPNQMRSSACKMVRTLIQLMRTLDKMPEERTILMKLLYYDDVTPADYEPPFFKSCTEEEAVNPWAKSPLKMEVGDVNSKHFVLALKVKSVLDPCEDENDDDQDNSVSLGADSFPGDDSESDSEFSHSDDDQYIVAPIEKQDAQDNGNMADEDDTQDPAEDEQQIDRLKDWINSYHLDRVEVTDVLSHFPDISVDLVEGNGRTSNKDMLNRCFVKETLDQIICPVPKVLEQILLFLVLFILISEIVEKLVKEGMLSSVGTDCYIINKQKKFNYEFDIVKEEIDGQQYPKSSQLQHGKDEDYMYMKALYHALPMNYVTISNLRSKLGGETNQTTVKKLIDKMTEDGFIEAKSKRRLGKRVIHSDLTEKKLVEVKKVLEKDAMDVDMNKSENNPTDLSTCGALHSIGSDLTRTRGKSDAYQNGSALSDQTVSKRRDHENTPSSRAEPIASTESFVPGKENGKSYGSTNHFNEFETVICSRSGKRKRKASMVEEPILQFGSRQKSQIA